MDYADVFTKLIYEAATVIFIKKDGKVRIMLCTRNLALISLEYGFQGKALGGHDNKCNIKNGNIAVFDLIIGEARSFNINRLVSVDYHKSITTKEELDKVIQEYKSFKQKYEETMPMEITMESI